MDTQDHDNKCCKISRRFVAFFCVIFPILCVLYNWSNFHGKFRDQTLVEPSQMAIETPTVQTKVTGNATNNKQHTLQTLPATTRSTKASIPTTRAQKSRDEPTILKKDVTIFVAIISAPRWSTRRDAIRSSWFMKCSENGVPCFFFTDSQDMQGKVLPSAFLETLQQEQSLHGDLILTQSPGGINFALRYLWILGWANERYSFQYFLRIDDDYFVCMDRLVRELQYRPRNKLYWGYVHCHPPGGIRVDEGFVIVSNDLAQYFLREQNKTLMCHPYGDQALAMWINNIPEVTYFGDPRVHHTLPPLNSILKNDDICEKYIAYHRSYPAKMRLFWAHFIKVPKKTYSVPPVTFPCGEIDKKFNYTSFGGKFGARPRPCRETPTWSIGEFYPGRDR